MQQIVSQIADFPLFSGLSKDELTSMLEEHPHSVTRSQKGQIIHMQGDACHTVDIILDGEVAVQRIDAEGHVLTIEVFPTGDVVGANLIFATHNAYPMTVVARTDVQLLHLPRETILSWAQGCRTFLSLLLHAVSDRTLVLTDKIGTLSHKSIRRRITDYLHSEYRTQGRAVLVLGMAKKELAERLGMPRSSLGRELLKMREDGLIDYDAKSITIKDTLLREWN